MGDRAKINGKAERLLEWIKGWDGFDGYAKLNAIVTQEGDASLNIVVNDDVVEPYIDGTALRDYTFMIKMILPWSDGFDPVNVESGNTAASLLDWIDGQFPHNLPDWERADIRGITLVNNAPSLDTVDTEESIAEYSVIAKIRYVE